MAVFVSWLCDCGDEGISDKGMTAIVTKEATLDTRYTCHYQRYTTCDLNGPKDCLGSMGILMSIPVVLMKEGNKLKTNQIVSTNLIALGLRFPIMLDTTCKARGRGWFTRTETE